jgi:hypothetical protein
MRYYYSAFALALCGFGLSQNAQAADISFNFLVNSSGADLYACDAGIWDPEFSLTLPSFPRGSAAQSNIQARVGTYNNGNLIRSWKDIMVQSNIILPPITGPFHTVAYPAGYPKLSIPVIQKLNNVIENSNSGTANGELTFNLASDYYGARYFVDFCYRGSQLPYPTGTYGYNVSDQVTATDIKSGTYLTDAALEVQGKIVCHERSSSQSEDWSSTIINDFFPSDDSVLLGLDGDSMAQSYTTTASAFYGTAQSVFGSTPSPHSFSISTAPAKYCVIRYIFRENSIQKRKWDINSAEFTIDLTMNNASYTPAQ